MVTFLGQVKADYPAATRTLLNWAGSIKLHYNDFFCYASSDSVTLEDTDFHWAVPFVEQWGADGVEAIGCLLMGGMMPIEPKRTPALLAAYNALVASNPVVTSEQD